MSEHEHAFELFGTHVRVLVAAGPDAALSALRVQARLHRMHRALTRFDATSELSALNDSAGQPVAVSATLLQALGAALSAARASGGLVDPTILRDLERAGYARSRAGTSPAPLAAAIAAAPPRRPAAARRGAPWRRIELDTRRGTAFLPAGVRVDLGGSAKGLAVDVAAGMLARHATFAVDAGGDIRMGGAEPAQRTVSIDHPLGGPAHQVAVTTGAVATSGLRTRVWRTPDGYAHHLIDPARGVPAWTGVIQATAFAPTALEAETLAKTALLRGPREGREILARGGGALILDDGELVLAGEIEPAGVCAA